MINNCTADGGFLRVGDIWRDNVFSLLLSTTSPDREGKGMPGRGTSMHTRLKGVTVGGGLRIFGVDQCGSVVLRWMQETMTESEVRLSGVSLWSPCQRVWDLVYQQWRFVCRAVTWTTGGVERLFWGLCSRVRLKVGGQVKGKWLRNAKACSLGKWVSMTLLLEITGA